MVDCAEQQGLGVGGSETDSKTALGVSGVAVAVMAGGQDFFDYDVAVQPVDCARGCGKQAGLGAIDHNVIERAVRVALGELGGVGDVEFGGEGGVGDGEILVPSGGLGGSSFRGVAGLEGDGGAEWLLCHDAGAAGMDGLVDRKGGESWFACAEDAELGWVEGGPDIGDSGAPGGKIYWAGPCEQIHEGFGDVMAVESDATKQMAGTGRDDPMKVVCRVDAGQIEVIAE